ncbi:hypothetical protein NDU88_000375 [Pleurodeles waltl]|uniref:Uncharacterized protein n=1 Tax=Pleurodeles waltl TaxID=8319 RepID=A0AAV7VWF3_PLEWA|nr:hypothetical protein NDU88_000375 [Pleurodeles waltl]
MRSCASFGELKTIADLPEEAQELRSPPVPASTGHNRLTLISGEAPGSKDTHGLGKGAHSRGHMRDMAGTLESFSEAPHPEDSEWGRRQKACARARNLARRPRGGRCRDPWPVLGPNTYPEAFSKASLRRSEN